MTFKHVHKIPGILGLSELYALASIYVEELSLFVVSDSWIEFNNGIYKFKYHNNVKVGAWTTKSMHKHNTISHLYIPPEVTFDFLYMVNNDDYSELEPFFDELLELVR